MVQQLENNIVCVVIQVLVVVCGGMQLLYINGQDEVFGLLIEDLVCIVLCMQQIIVYESGIIEFFDLLGGFFVFEQFIEDIV